MNGYREAASHTPNSTATCREASPRAGLLADKRALVDRIEWSILPDSSTAMAAIQTGEADWYEYAAVDLLPTVAKNKSVVISTLDPIGCRHFSWATEFPDFMKGTVAVVTSLGPPPRPILERITSMLRVDPNWNGGDYYATGGVVDTLTDLRENTLRSYGIGEDLKKAFFPNGHCAMPRFAKWPAYGPKVSTPTLFSRSAGR